MLKLPTGSSINAFQSVERRFNGHHILYALLQMEAGKAEGH